MAARKNFTIEQGSKFVVNVTVWEDGVGGTLKNLTGYDARMQVREGVSSVVKTLNLTSNPTAGISINSATSVITITITATQTSAMNAENYVYDLEILPSANEDEAIRYLQGTLILSREVTR